MSHLEDLYAAIVAHRRDDGPRLQYADAVEAEDPDHAAFIRAQVALAKAPARRHTDPALRTSLQTETRLLPRLCRRLRSTVAGMVPQSDLRRGFVEGVSVDAARFPDVAEALFRAAPILDLRLRASRPHLREVLASPATEGLRSLDLQQGGLDDRDAATIAASPRLAGLRWLDLSFNTIGAEGLHALAASPHLRELRVLRFSFNRVPSPVPELIDEHGAVHGVVTPPLGAALRDRYGDLAWLHPPTHPSPSVAEY